MSNECISLLVTSKWSKLHKQRLQFFL